MQTVFEVLFIVLPIFGLVYAGYFFRKIKICTDEWVHVLNQFVYYVSLPAIISVSFWQINVREPMFWSIVGANTGAVLAYALILFCFLQLLPWKRGNLKAAAFMVGIVGNTVYVGFPLLADAFGKALLPYSIAAATVHLVLGLVLSILAVEFWVIKSKRASAYIVDFFKNPFFSSLAVGVFLSLVNFKGPVADMIQKPIFMLGATASPLALFALGGFLHGKFAPHHLFRSVGLTVLKLAVFPALVWLFVRLMGLGADFTAVSVVVASMPSAVTAFVIAEKYHLDNDLVANTILLSTAISVLTISLFLLRFI